MFKSNSANLSFLFNFLLLSYFSQAKSKSPCKDYKALHDLCSSSPLWIHSHFLSSSITLSGHFGLLPVSQRYKHCSHSRTFAFPIPSAEKAPFALATHTHITNKWLTFHFLYTDFNESFLDCTIKNFKPSSTLPMTFPYFIFLLII